MRREFRLWFIWGLIMGPSLAPSQTPGIHWWSLDGGFQYSPGSGVAVIATGGQNAAGVMQGDNLRLTAGFLAHPGTGAAVLGIPADPGLPAEFSLAQNFPNPFNPTTLVRYQLPVVSEIRLSIFDLLGREVDVPVHGVQPPGTYEVRWNAAGMASGVYFYRLTAGDFVQTRKMVVVK
jgi:hypothetical protein